MSKRNHTTRTHTPKAKPWLVTVNKAHPAPSLERMCIELMRIATDAKRQGLHPTTIAAWPTPRVYAINSER